MTTSSIGSPLHQRSIRNRILQAFVGQVASSVEVLRDLVNQNPQAKQVDTITVGTATGGADYVFTFNGVEYTYSEPAGSPTTSTVATALAAFMQDIGAIYGVVDISVAANVITLTAKNPGFTFTLSDADAKIASASVTAADDADPIPFGAAVVETGMASTMETAAADTMELGALPTVLSAQSVTYTVADPGAGQNFLCTVQILGLPEVISVSTLWASDLDTTLDNLATILNAALADYGYDGLLSAEGPGGATAGAGEFILLAGVAGVEFSHNLTCDDHAGYPAITYDDNVGLGTSLIRSFAGAAKRTSDHEASYNPGANSSAEWGANSVMSILSHGDIWVELADTVAYGDQVFVDVTDGSFQVTPSADTAPLPKTRARWVRNGRTQDGDTLALLRLM